MRINEGENRKLMKAINNYNKINLKRERYWFKPINKVIKRKWKTDIENIKNKNGLWTWERYTSKIKEIIFVLIFDKVKLDYKIIY